ncbi:MAG TPA: hypothetical protein VLA61_18795 [Ideonella sp.]|uniref:hypothetical protein n=1 Tax=Ideonella sp. TaxID=1929293 RepID=UPI002C659BF3|nr:hypothetical protein [Ideonella sp.]HSI50324.1 hypothetical protein [Ideonella sp.]
MKCLKSSAWLALLMTAVLGSACRAPAAATPDNGRAMVDAAVGEPRCSQDAQCHTVAIGHRACGGPEAYAPWSTLTANEAQVRRAADSYSAERKAAQQRSGEVSICIMVTDPGARCDAATYRCVLNPPAAVRPQGPKAQ